MALTGTNHQPFTDDIAHCPMIDQAQAAWKTWSECRAAERAGATKASARLSPTPAEPMQFQMVADALKAWKNWSAQDCSK